MCPDHDKSKKDEDTGSTSAGGQDDKGTRGGRGSQVDIRIATWAGDSRNEPRTPAERREFALRHEFTQLARARETRERKNSLTAGREPSPDSLNRGQAFRPGQGGEAGGTSPYKKHPISNTAYFSGKEQSKVPLNETDQKNLEDRPENKLRNQLAFRNTPKWTPPTLTR